MTTEFGFIKIADRYTVPFHMARHIVGTLVARCEKEVTRAPTRNDDG